jgi:hypothetical protein
MQVKTFNPMLPQLAKNDWSAGRVMASRDFLEVFDTKTLVDEYHINKLKVELSDIRNYS